MNKAGLGFDNKPHIYTFTSFPSDQYGLINIFGWLDGFKKEFVNQDLWFFTPNASLLTKNKTFQTLFTNIFNGLKCNMHFFINDTTGFLKS